MKNFQLEAEDTVLLTVGKFSDDAFVLDFAFPLSVVQVRRGSVDGGGCTLSRVCSCTTWFNNDFRCGDVGC